MEESDLRADVEAVAQQSGIVADWNRTRYHAPSDDLSQPVDKQGAADFCRVLTALIERVAGRIDRPRWNEQSFFKRFAAAD